MARAAAIASHRTKTLFHRGRVIKAEEEIFHPHRRDCGSEDASKQRQLQDWDKVVGNPTLESHRCHEGEQRQRQSRRNAIDAPRCLRNHPVLVDVVVSPHSKSRLLPFSRSRPRSVFTAVTTKQIRLMVRLVIRAPRIQRSYPLVDCMNE